MRTDTGEIDLDRATKLLGSATEDEPLLHVLHVVGGLHTGEIWLLEEGESLVGRSSGNALRFEDFGVSRQHASLTLREDRVSIQDLGSLNGTFVNGAPLSSPRELLPADLIRLGQTRLRYSREGVSEVKHLRDLHAAVSRDHLTGVYNRRYFEERLETEIAYCLRHRAPLSLLALDVDFFKRVNDAHGHPVGDLVLCAVASALQSATRVEDITARTGGEEFMVIARGTATEGALFLAKRLLARIRELEIPISGEVLRVTLSAGVSGLDSSSRVSSRGLIGAADHALLRAKREGRDCVRVGSPSYDDTRTTQKEPGREEDGT